ncbi:MAG: NAD-dependent deacylase [Flavobacteriales bacterium]|nr:NAD-dependent deacylase [Flavobacteriales bacterium]
MVVLSGAGISAESGISTFRDSNGLWENHRIEDVATPEGWNANPKLVLEFYNQRRKQLFEVEPNEGHKSLVKLEDFYDVQIVTQNVDDLHERAGSSNVLHLHGELKKVRSTIDHNLVYDLDHWELKSGDKCENGSQLRPHIVWFGEAVPNIMLAEENIRKADVLIIVGTSLNVYPAAGLVDLIKEGTKVYIVDPADVTVNGVENITVIKAGAVEGLAELVNELSSSEQY